MLNVRLMFTLCVVTAVDSANLSPSTKPVVLMCLFNQVLAAYFISFVSLMERGGVADS